MRYFLSPSPRRSRSRSSHVGHPGSGNRTATSGAGSCAAGMSSHSSTDLRGSVSSLQKSESTTCHPTWIRALSSNDCAADCRHDRDPDHPGHRVPEGALVQGVVDAEKATMMIAGTLRPARVTPPLATTNPRLAARLHAGAVDATPTAIADISPIAPVFSPLPSAASGNSSGALSTTADVV